MENKIIKFSGIEWYVKEGYRGPGPNNWSDNPESVWVDSSGKLHLKIRKSKDTWYCAEVFATKSYGYGEYGFQIESNVCKYLPNVVAGLFTYENDDNEIDIEFSGWENNSESKGYYTIQPGPYDSKNQSGFKLNLNGTHSTHKFDWQAKMILFESYHGHYNKLPSLNFLMNSWNYSGNKIPMPGNERLHINLWLKEGTPWSIQQETELIISAVKVPNF